MEAPLSWEQIGALALRAGWSPADAVIATSITQPESSRIPDNIQQGQPYIYTGWGLWQITPGDSEPQFGIDSAMLDPWNNARAAYAKWQGRGGSFAPWTTWEAGKNVPWIPDATAGVAAVAKLSPEQLARLVDEIRPGPGGVGPQQNYQDWSAQVRQASQSLARITLRQHQADTALRHARLRFTTPTVVISRPGQVLQNPGSIYGD